MKAREHIMDDVRSWYILVGRSGFASDELTLREIGDELGLTRERVRQLHVKAVNRLQATMHYFRPMLDALEEQEDLLSSMGFETAPLLACQEIQRTLYRLGLTSVTQEDVKRLLITIRASMQREYFGWAHGWPRVSIVACMLASPINKHPKITPLLRRYEECQSVRIKKWTYIDLAERVLRNAGEPLHWKEIVARAEATGLRDEITPTPMYNAIMATNEKFARVASGTYGLVEAGYKDVPYYPEIIAETMRNSGGPLSAGAILKEVNGVRPIKKSSLMMFLDLHSDFYRSVEGTYGLREWLPPRHKQTLRTPIRFIEDEKSHARLANAAQHGYDVSKYT